MPANAVILLYSCLFLVILTAIVAARMLMVRTSEMRQKRIHPQAVAKSADAASRYENTQAADNFRNLFEIPVLFYALAASALALSYFPIWLAYGAVIFVALRYLHSFIHCTYNKVMHRFAAFFLSFVVIVVLWVAFVLTVTSRATA